MNKKYANEILEMSRRGYEDIARDFSATRKVFWQELHYLGDYVKEGDKVLDIGCGNGRFLEAVSNTDFQYTGIDSSRSFIKQARETYGKRGAFVRGDALSLPFEDNSFDTIVSFGVLHHIPSKAYRKQFLAEARRVLKPGGIMIITVWNLWNERLTPTIRAYTIKKLLGRSKLDFKDVFLPFGKKENVRYLHAFTKGELARVIKRARFTLQDIRLVRRRSGNENIVAICKKS